MTPAPKPPRAIHISGHAREVRDFYATPDWVTEALLRHMRPRDMVWEPCCGTGAIADTLLRRGYPVLASDIADHGYGTPGIDLLACTAMPPGCGALITNPPYGDGGEQRERARTPSALLDLLRHLLALTAAAEAQLALLVRLQWIAGQRAAALIDAAPCTHIVALTRRIRWFEQGGVTNNAQHHHAWVVFDHRRRRRDAPRFVFAD
jgi:hypothetical protein